MIHELTDDDFNQFINKTKIVLVVFSASWCSPCAVNKKIYEEIVQEFETDQDVTFCSVNVDTCPLTSAEWNIVRIPHTIIFVNGIEKRRYEGVLIKKELVDLIKSKTF